MTDLLAPLGQIVARRPPLAGQSAIQGAVDAYQMTAKRIGLPSVQLLTPSRVQKLRARLRECGGLDGWRKALENLEAWPWGRGENPSGWRASFDFMLQASSFAKLFEGAYPNGQPATRPADTSATSRALAELARSARGAAGD